MPFLNPERKPILHHPQGHKIDVITSHKQTGELIPLYFRVEDDYNERFIFKLSSIQAIKEKTGSITYQCAYLAYGRMKIILLSLDVTRCVWVIVQ